MLSDLNTLSPCWRGTCCELPARTPVSWMSPPWWRCQMS